MKKQILSIVAIATISLTSFGQEGFHEMYRDGEYYPEIGGYYFYCNGIELAVESIDQGHSVSWNNAQTRISDPANHSADGKKFDDWRMPTIDELHALYQIKHMIKIWGNDIYWSSTPNPTDNSRMLQLEFENGEVSSDKKDVTLRGLGGFSGLAMGSYSVRAVRPLHSTNDVITTDTISLTNQVNGQEVKDKCVWTSDTSNHMFTKLVIRGPHDHIFWSGDTLNILSKEIEHIFYDTINNVPTFFNDQDFDNWIQCRLDDGATPRQLIYEFNNPEFIVPHLYGKNYAGGLIFYVDVFGGGKVAHPTDIQIQNLNWWAAVGEPKNLSTGGFTDWFLPTKDELNMMYKILKEKGLGGFAESEYWSSTSDERSSSYDAWYQNFTNGVQAHIDKGRWYKLARAIRAF